MSSSKFLTVINIAQGHGFDPETARLLGLAFEMAIVALQHADRVVSPTRDVVAQKIIELAKAGERDPGRLCDAALEACLQSIVSDPSPLPPHASPQEPQCSFSLLEGGWRIIRNHRPGLRALQASVAERQVVLPLSERERPCPRSTNITRTREIAFGGPPGLGPKSSESGS